MGQATIEEDDFVAGLMNSIEHLSCHSLIRSVYY